MSTETFLMLVPFICTAFLLLGAVIGILGYLKYMQYKTKKMMSNPGDLMGEMLGEHEEMFD